MARMSRWKPQGGFSPQDAFSPMTMVVLALVGIICAAGLTMLSAYAPELRKGDDGGGHALSRSSVGYAALVRLLSLSGEPVLTSRGPLPATAEGGLLVFTPAPGMEASSVKRVGPYGPMLVVPPKWTTAPDPRRKGWVRTLGEVRAKDALGVVPAKAGLALADASGVRTIRLFRPKGQPIGRSVRIRNPRSLAMPPGSRWTPVIVDQDGAPVLVMREKPWIYVLADPDLLNTSALKTADGAQTAIAILDLIRAKGTPVIFDLTQHGFTRPRSILRLALEPPLLGATLVLAALAVLAGMQALARFGPSLAPVRAVALGKTALADNTADLIRLARREARMAPLYASLIRASAARAIGAPRALEGQALDDFLDRVSTTIGASHTYSTLAERARAATVSDLTRVARDLHAWKQELIRGRH
jgi:hypothetical protein